MNTNTNTETTADTAARFVNRYESDDWQWEAEASIAGEDDYIFSVGAIKAPTEADALALAKTVNRIVHHGQWEEVDVRVTRRR